MSKNVVFLQLCMSVFNKLIKNGSEKSNFIDYNIVLEKTARQNGKLNIFAQNCFFCDNHNIDKNNVYVSRG